MDFPAYLELCKYFHEYMDMDTTRLQQSSPWLRVVRPQTMIGAKLILCSLARIMCARLQHVGPWDLFFFSIFPLFNYFYTVIAYVYIVISVDYVCKLRL